MNTTPNPNNIDRAEQEDFPIPDIIEDCLESFKIRCVAFNRRGTLLATGCSNGRVIIWDFDNKRISKEFIVEDCTGTITNICWSKNGHHMLVSAADKSLTLLDITKRENIARTTLLQADLKVHLHPISSNPSLCLVCPIASPPMIIDMLAKTEKILPISIGNDVDPSDVSHTPACFNKYGDLIYVGNLKGEILIIDHKRIEIRGVISIPGNDVIKNLVFSRNGQHLLTNLDYKTIRIYDNLLPSIDGLKALDKLHQESDGDEKSRAVGRRCLALSCEIKDMESDVKWRAPCFSGNGEWIVGGSTERLTHKMYIWDREGSVVRILEGPNDAVMDIVWHPVKPIIVSVSLAGTAYIWGKEYVSNWSAPYMEIDQSEENVEGEEEFDTVPDEVQEEEEEEDVGESRLSEEPRDGRLTTNDHASIPPEDDSARPAKRERRPSRKYFDFYL